ncbi:mutS protein [Pelomyxa schiedti]|nr:mutS protein [Pelomyxa schiedti]
MALLDMLTSFATYSMENNCVRPLITADGPLAITQGRHPILEKILHGGFVPNDSYICDTSSYHIILGPNMSGKSTYIRQVALLTILAHIGCFVPATFASFRLVDRILSRIGSDESTEGNASSFMTEMREIHYILQNQSDRALVLIDELGRGTSTAEGEALAWSISEHLALRSFGHFLFVTHYSRLSLLQELYPNIATYHFQVERNSREGFRPLFLLSQGGNSSNSRYAIAVAEVSGMPKTVIDYALRVRDTLQAEATSDDAQTCTCGNPEQAAMLLAEKLFHLKHSTLDTESKRAYLKKLKEDICKSL